MIRRFDRRRFLRAAGAAAVAAGLPRRLWAGVDAVPRSDYGFETTAEEVVAAIDLTGRSVLITGCNSGLGYEAMRVMAGRGAHVIGTGRTLEKARQACDSVAGRTTPLACELTDFDSVAGCAQRVVELGEPLDVLMCNAGIMALPELERVYGLEKQFVVNHLGHYILTRRLLGRIEQAAAGRIVVLSSLAYRSAPPEGIRFDNLSGEDGYKPFVAYGQSKLANALFSRELARRFDGTSVTSNSVHPGVVATNLGRYFMKEPRDPDAPLRPGMKTVEQGAATQVYVAADPRLAGVSGHYFEDCNPVEPEGPHMHDDALARKLWDVSEQLTAAYLE